MNNQFFRKHWQYFVLLAWIILVSFAFTRRSEENLKIPMKPDGIPEALERSEKVYQNYVEKRRNYWKSHPSHRGPWSGLMIWNYFVPAFTCPFDAERIGHLGDGGKWVCGFNQYEKSYSDGKSNNQDQDPCVVYSFGVADDSSFEAEVLNRTNCTVFAFDGTVAKIGRGVTANPRLHFEKVFVSNLEDSKGSLTLGQIMRKNNHTFIDILKMDVEGAEFKVLDQIMKEFEFLPFGQLSVELHFDYNNEIKTVPQLYKWWERLERKGLRAFRNELNLIWNGKHGYKPTLIEYSFVNVRNRRSKFNIVQKERKNVSV